MAIMIFTRLTVSEALVGETIPVKVVLKNTSDSSVQVPDPEFPPVFVYELRSQEGTVLHGPEDRPGLWLEDPDPRW